MMRYLYNADHFDSNTGAILFYCGNEGDIENFAINTVSKPLSSVYHFFCFMFILFTSACRIRLCLRFHFRVLCGIWLGHLSQ